MSKILFCDRCGAQIASNSTKAIPFNSSQCTRIFDKSGFATCVSYDLCGKCDNELEEFLKKKEKDDIQTRLIW